MAKSIRKISLFVTFILCAFFLVSCSNLFGENTPTAEPVVTLTPEPDNPQITTPTPLPDMTQEDVVKDFFDKRKLCISFYLPFFGGVEAGSEKCPADDGLEFILSYYNFYNEYTEYKHEIDDDNFYYEIPSQIVQDLFDKTFSAPPQIKDSSFYNRDTDIVRYEHTGEGSEPSAGILEVESVSKDADRYFITFSGNESSAILTVRQSEAGYVLESYLPSYPPRYW